MDSSMYYRSATLGDLPALQRLGLASYGQFEKELTPGYWAELAANLGAEAVYHSLVTAGESFLCIKDETPVGMAFLVPSGNPTDIYPADWSYIRLVGVHPACAGMGIGRALMLRCIDAAHLNGEKTLGLHTSAMMHAARQGTGAGLWRLV
ncbi:MAG: GNAT family N-acetyltransferase [Chitinophagaceae bacterium]|nr:GNAT family N-acetyltransferase [Chitinophagaceae bacterium]